MRSIDPYFLLLIRNSHLFRWERLIGYLLKIQIYYNEKPTDKKEESNLLPVNKNNKYKIITP
ncbi:hypothetical protein DL897_07355 [Thermoflavimicrobium daqui]|uniref:Uncharacterized protein n=1 Tax=Thermoflavimicrobium daqui TaxID=2137476 RepID=A0A364K6F4_9BACL|nr:hypothetical protein DL897_07355 [Thermoflavimicrobium daqui]